MLAAVTLCNTWSLLGRPPAWASPGVLVFASPGTLRQLSAKLVAVCGTARGWSGICLLLRLLTLLLSCCCPYAVASLHSYSPMPTSMIPIAPSPNPRAIPRLYPGICILPAPPCVCVSIPLSVCQSLCSHAPAFLSLSPSSEKRRWRIARYSYPSHCCLFVHLVWRTSCNHK